MAAQVCECPLLPTPALHMERNLPACKHHPLWAKGLNLKITVRHLLQFMGKSCSTMKNKILHWTKIIWSAFTSIFYFIIYLINLDGFEDLNSNTDKVLHWKRRRTLWILSGKVIGKAENVTDGEKYCLMYFRYVRKLPEFENQAYYLVNYSTSESRQWNN